MVVIDRFHCRYTKQERVSLLQYVDFYDIVIFSQWFQIYSLGLLVIIWTMWCSTMAIPHASQAIGRFFRCASFWCSRSLSYFFIDVAINGLFYRGEYWYHWHVYVHGYPNWTTDLGFLKLGNFGSAIGHLSESVCPWIFRASVYFSFWIYTA